MVILYFALNFLKKLDRGLKTQTDGFSCLTSKLAYR